MARASSATSAAATSGARGVPPADVGAPGRSKTMKPGTERSSTVSDSTDPPPSRACSAFTETSPRRSVALLTGVPDHSALTTMQVTAYQAIGLKRYTGPTLLVPGCYCVLAAGASLPGKAV